MPNATALAEARETWNLPIEEYSDGHKQPAKTIITVDCPTKLCKQM